jgi:hypothetical protein
MSQSQIFKASRKVTKEDGSTVWVPVGYTVFLGEYEGRPSHSLIDDRTGERYVLFPLERKGSQDRNQSATSGPREVPPPSENDCPF